MWTVPRFRTVSAESRCAPATSSRQPPRVIGVGGGPGGAGKSLLTVSLGVYLAQLGGSVIIADVDPASAGLHTMLGLDPQRRPSTGDVDEPMSQTIATSIPGLLLMPAPDPSGGPVRANQRLKWLTKV